MIKKLITTIYIIGLTSFMLKLILNNDLANYIDLRYKALSIGMTITSALLALVLVYELINRRSHLAKDLKDIVTQEKLGKFLTNSTTLLLILPIAVCIYLELYLVALIVAILCIIKFNTYLKLFQNLGEILIILIIIVGFTLAPARLSDRVAGDRIDELNNIAASKADAPDIKYSFDTQNFTIADWIVAFNTNPRFNDYVGKQVHVSGFIFDDKKSDANHFLVARFVIRCCAVDAIPAGIIVDYTNWEDTFDSNDWVDVTGVFEIQQLAGEDSLTIKADKVEITQEPDDPYISGL